MNKKTTLLPILALGLCASVSATAQSGAYGYTAPSGDHFAPKPRYLDIESIQSVGSDRTFNDRFYTRLSANYILPHGKLEGTSISLGDALDNGIGFLAAFGYEAPLNSSDFGLQVELETGWSQFGSDQSYYAAGYKASFELEQVPMLLTVRGVFNLGQGWSVAAGPSIGLSYLKGKAKVSGYGSDNDSDTVTTYGIGAMISYIATENIAVDFGYRHLWFDDAKFDGGITLDAMRGHVFQLGVRVAF